MLWWTGCVGCGPTCGGQRRCSEPERAGGEQAGALGLRSFDGGGCRKEGSRGNEQDRRRPVSAKLEAALLVDRAKPKTPAVESEVSVDRDRTLSRSCLVQKSKNFVYRARTTPLRFAVLSRLGVGKLAGPVCVLSGGVRRFSTTRWRSVPRQLPRRVFPRLPTNQIQATTVHIAWSIDWALCNDLHSPTIAEGEVNRVSKNSLGFNFHHGQTRTAQRVSEDVTVFL
jgi:hypothetical protein